MNGLRRGVGLIAAALAAGAGVMALAGLAGAGVLVSKRSVFGWLDAVNHFALLWLAFAALGAAGALALPRGRMRAAAMIAAAFAGLAFGIPATREFAAGAAQPRPERPTLRILTFNRWWDSAEQARQAAFIRASGADVVALQEVYGFEATAATLADAYPYQLLCGEGCDTAILSKRPFLDYGPEARPRWPGGSSLLWVRIMAPDGRPAGIATAHLYWPIPPWIQRAQRAQLSELLRPFGDELVLVGDFNLTPWAWTMRRLDAQLEPLTRRTHGLTTFPATWPAPVLALDQVYAGRGWRAARATRLPRAGSDHYPVLVELGR